MGRWQWMLGRNDMKKAACGLFEVLSQHSLWRVSNKHETSIDTANNLTEVRVKYSLTNLKWWPTEGSYSLTCNLGVLCCLLKVSEANVFKYFLKQIPQHYVAKKITVIIWIRWPFIAICVLKWDPKHCFGLIYLTFTKFWLVQSWGKWKW
jgi:hypothetical protein